MYIAETIAETQSLCCWKDIAAGPVRPLNWQS